MPLEHQIGNGTQFPENGTFNGQGIIYERYGMKKKVRVGSHLEHKTPSVNLRLQKANILLSVPDAGVMQLYQELRTTYM